MAQWPNSIATDATLYVAVNSLQTTLSGTINSIVTTITLANSTGFPTAGAVTIDNEVIFYTGISGNQLTGCTRGSDGTTAASHNSGVPVGATIVAFHHNAVKDEIKAVETTLINYKTLIDFGADSTGVSDSTSAINSAIAANVPVYCPPGTYLTTGNHTITTQRLFGGGKGFTTFKRSSGTNPVFTMTGAGTLEGFTIDGNSLGGSALVLNGSIHGIVRDIDMKNVAGTSYAMLTHGTCEYLTIQNIEFHNNYGHLSVDETYYTFFDGITMFGSTDSAYAILFGTNGITDLNFENIYMESCISMTVTGLRDVRFRKVRVRLDTFPHPWFQSINTVAGNGGECANLRFTDLSVQKYAASTSIPLFDINNYQAYFQNVYVIDHTSSAGWSVIRDRGTFDLRLQDWEIESDNAWNLFDPASVGGAFTRADHVNYTQGAIGTAVWSSQVTPGGTGPSSYCTVRGSNINHSVASTHIKGGYIFEQIDGNVDLTNAIAPVWLWNISGTITDPNKAAVFNFNSASINTGLPVRTSFAGASALEATASFSGGVEEIHVENSSNTANSHAAVTARVDGTSAGDPYYVAQIVSGSSWSWGADNSDSDKWKLCLSTDLSSGDTLVVDTTGNLAITKTTNQLTLGVTNTTTLTAPAPASSRTWTLPDLSTNPTFAALEGTQTFTGTKTFNDFRGTFGADIAAGSHKITGLAAGSTNGDALRYEQLIGVYALDSAVVHNTGTESVAGAKTFTTQLIGKGTATNDNAAAGYIGEYIESVVLFSAPVTLTSSNTYYDITSISLTAGDWDVYGHIEFIGSSTVGTKFRMAVTDHSGDSGTNLVRGSNSDETPTAPTDTANIGLGIGAVRVSISTTTSYYLKAYSLFSAGTLTAYGRISARRVR